MQLHPSLNNFVEHPENFYLRVENGVLRAVPGSLQKIHALQPSQLRELKGLAATDNLAETVLGALRFQELNDPTSLQGRASMAEDLSFVTDLAEWCEEAIDTNQYEHRIEAARRIQECYVTNKDELDLGNLKIASLPASISRLAQLKTLDLGETQISSLPDWIRNLTRLELLDLRGTPIQTPPANTMNPNVTVLGAFETRSASDPEYLRLVEILDRWCQNATMTVLHNSAYFSEAPTAPTLEPRGIVAEIIEQCYLTNNVSLTISTQINDLPDVFSFFGNLRSIQVSESNITTLPSSIGTLSHLRSLELINNRQLITLPEPVRNLTKLTKFTLAGSGITTLPNWISELTHLQELNLKFNNLRIFPEALRNCTRIERLNLYQTGITILPTWIDSLSGLITLDLRGNEIVNFPDSMRNLACLRELYLPVRGITSVPNFISNLTNLTDLELSRFEGTTLPHWIGNLTRLQVLDIGFSSVTSLPDELSNLTHLRRLIIRNSQIASLPLSLAHLPSTCTIEASFARITANAARIFQDELVRIRTEDPNLGPWFNFSIDDAPRPKDVTFSTLEEALTFYLREFQSAFPEKPTKTVEQLLAAYIPIQSHPDNDLLRQFLGKLQKTEDFQHPNSKCNTLLRANRMLDGMATNEAFRNKAFLILEDGLSTCGDRVALIFNQIEVQWWIMCQAESLPNLKLAVLLIGAERLSLIDRIAREQIQRKRLGDQIEVFLYYQINLKKALKLPITTEGMLYSGTAGTTPEEVEAAKQAILRQTTSADDITRILSESPDWADRLEQEDHELALIRATYQRAVQLEDAKESRGEITRGQQDTNIRALDKDFIQRRQERVFASTQLWVQKYIDEILSTTL